MFNEGFFPTPAHIISKMMAPVRDRLHKSIILEPSAGKGDILDYLIKHNRVSKKNMYAIEIEPELQMVLAGKEYTVIGDDFLTFTEPYKVSLILMNPPFANGAEHLLKAWNVVADGGAVVCLLNTETINNPHTRQRQLLGDIIDKHGTVTELGTVFKNAERRTDVHVSMVVLEKPERNFDDPFADLDLDEDAPQAQVSYSAAPLAERDLVKSLVAQYNAAVRALHDKALADAKVQFFTRSVVDLRKQAQEAAGQKYTYAESWKPMSVNGEIQKLKEMFWAYIFDKTQLANITTSKVREEFQERQKRQRNMAFTVENVYAVLEAVMYNAEDTIKQCVVDVFDTATAYHERNKIHVEGWKTNKSYKVNQKLIVPYYCSALAYRAGQFMDDFDKALCHLSGNKFTDITQTRKVIDDHRRGDRPAEVGYSDEIESEFFTIRIYLKGTVHLKFKDKALHAKFNQTAAEGKNWVGAGY